MAKRKARVRKQKPVSDGVNRLPNGHFAKGNPGGPGNPLLRRLAEYRATVNATVTPERLRRVLEKLLKLAEAGDLVAARVILERALGRNFQASAGGGADFDLTAIARPADAVRAVTDLMRAVSAGQLSPEDAARLAGVVDVAVKAITAHDLEERITQLEEKGAPDDR